MAEAALVDADIDFGREIVQALDEESDTQLKPLAAFWLLLDDEDLWRLVLVLPALEHEAPQKVYSRVLDVMNRRIHHGVSLDAIGLAPPSYPLRLTLRTAITTGPDEISGIRFKHNVINGQLIDDAYIYRLT